MHSRQVLAFNLFRSSRRQQRPLSKITKPDRLLRRRANVRNANYIRNLSGDKRTMSISLLQRRANARNVNYIRNLSGEKRTMSISLLQRRANARNVNYIPNLSGEKRTMSTSIDQNPIKLTRQHR